MNKENDIEDFNNILENDALLDIFSTVGLTEELNQDNFEVSSNKNLTVLILASGIGGGSIAELISSMVTEKALELLEGYHYHQKSSEEIRLFLKSIFSIVNKLVLDYINISNIQGYATTLSIALIYKNSLFMAHIGESRIYVVRRDDTPTLLSTDPSYSKKFSKTPQEVEESYFLGDESYDENNMCVTHEGNLLHKEKLFLCSKHILDVIPENKFDKEIEEIKNIIDKEPSLLSSTFLRYTHYERSIEKIKISVEDRLEENTESEIDWERLMPLLKKIALILGIILLLGFFYLAWKGSSGTDSILNEYEEQNNSLVKSEYIETPPLLIEEEHNTITSVLEPIIEKKEKVEKDNKLEHRFNPKFKLLQKKDSTVFHVGEGGIRITFKENRLVSSMLGTFHISNRNPKEIYCELNDIDSDLNGDFVKKLNKQIFSDRVRIKSINNSVKMNIIIKEECSYTQSMWGKNNGLDLFIFRCEEVF